MREPVAEVRGVDDQDLAVFVELEGRITSGERTGIEARWEFGRALLAKRDGKGRLANKVLADLIERTGQSMSELKYRAQFAERVGSKAELAKTLANYPSWWQIVSKFLPTRQKRPAAVTPPLPEGRFPVIMADPPWPYDEGWPEFADKAGDLHTRLALPYGSMEVEAISSLEVSEVAAADCHLFLWTTNRYLRNSYDVAESWGFEFSQMLSWCKPPRGIGPGGVFSNTTEFILYARRGSPAYKERIDSTWWTWPRGAHSEKPGGFYDIIERAFDGPYLSLFAGQGRAGWTNWGVPHVTGKR